MKKISALLVGSAFFVASAAFADTTIEKEKVSSDGVSSSATAITHENKIVAPAVVQKTKIKETQDGAFGKTKIKNETTTVTP